MDTTVNTYENRIEILIPLPDGVEAVAGGADIREERDESDQVTARIAVWTYSLGRWDEPETEGAEPTFVPTDIQQAARECYLLLVASTPGPDLEPAPEEPLDTQTVVIEP